MSDDERRGWWRAADAALVAINSIDTEGLTPNEVRSAIYHALMLLRPDIR